jgi:hypothetical protein
MVQRRTKTTLASSQSGGRSPCELAGIASADQAVATSAKVRVTSNVLRTQSAALRPIRDDQEQSAGQAACMKPLSEARLRRGARSGDIPLVQGKPTRIRGRFVHFRVILATQLQATKQAIERPGGGHHEKNSLHYRHNTVSNSAFRRGC